MLFCLCVTTNLVDINKLNTLSQVSCFILVCCLGRNKQLSVKKAHVSAATQLHAVWLLSDVNQIIILLYLP